MQLSIVSYIGKNATTQIREWQQEISEVTGSRASLDSWEPHVTVGDGVEINDNKLDELVGEIENAAKTVEQFQLQISGFGSLDSRPTGKGEVSTPYVIYAKVVIGDDLLKLVGKVGEVTKGYEKWYEMPNPYHPHVTLAFRDLTEESYQKGLKYLEGKTINITSVVDHIALVEKLEDVDREVARVELQSS